MTNSNMEYPRKIILDNSKLKTLLEEKGELIKVGRAKTNRIEEIETKMVIIDQKVVEEEKKVDISDLLDEEKEITKVVERAIEKMKDIKKRIFERMKDKVDSALHTEYEELNKEKEKLEAERNKIAIKAQKFNDKIIPLGRKLMSPYIQDEFEDYDTLRLEDGKVVATIFSHLNDFKTNFINKKQ